MNENVKLEPPQRRSALLNYLSYRITIMLSRFDSCLVHEGPFGALLFFLMYIKENSLRSEKRAGPDSEICADAHGYTYYCRSDCK